MGQLDRSAVDDAFQRLMAKENRMVAMEIWKQILREALEFWRLNCHVEIEERAIDDIGECREFSELTRVWGWRLGRVQGGELKSLRGLMGDVFGRR